MQAEVVGNVHFIKLSFGIQDIMQVREMKALLYPVFVFSFQTCSAVNNQHIQQNHSIIACYTQRTADIFISVFSLV